MHLKKQLSYQGFIHLGIWDISRQKWELPKFSRWKQSFKNSRNGIYKTAFIKGYPTFCWRGRNIL